MADQSAVEVLNWWFGGGGTEVECAICPRGALGWALGSKRTDPTARTALWDYAISHLALAHGSKVAIGDQPEAGSVSGDAGRDGPPFTHPDDRSARLNQSWFAATA